ncbi:type II secretion system F family protein [Pseudarthrobacter sp. H2]|uniref:type II secretion system F family protein n=1 Tax=Pseudarthrobacter sp. H2 TaxID=3418415 RepID=UPI003CEB39D5
MTATSPIFFALGVGLCLVALSILLFSTMGIGKAGIAMSRRRPGVKEEHSLLTRMTDSAATFVAHNVGRNASFGTRESLEQAGLRLRQADFILLVCCIGVTVGIVGFILAGVVMGLLFLVLTPFGAMLFLRILTNRRRAKFEDQLGDTLQMLAGGLRAGHSLLRSVDAVAQEAESPTSEEFARLVNETRLGRDLKDSMLHAARRLKSEDFDWTGQAIEIHREVGGDLAEVLDRVGETIRERAEVKGQVQSLSAEGKLSAYILVALPVGMFLFLNATSPSFIGVMYSNFLGWMLLGAAVVMLALGSLWLSRVVKIKF